MIPDFYIELLQKQYNEENVKLILDGYRVKRRVTLRVNNLKTSVDKVKSEFNKLGINYEEVSFYNNALIINNKEEYELRELNLYKNGEIYLQSLSSMLPPIILNPKPNMDILDMCAAPGGKTTELAALANNDVHITACEMNPIRLERLKYNIEKQGANCVFPMKIDARQIDEFFSFDSVLLDAPCSGSGTLSIDDKNMETTFTKQLIGKSIKSQQELLKKAIKVLKQGCEIVYSTCSILSCENENIVNEILKDNKIEIVPIDFEGIEELPLLPTKINGTICVAPNELYEGFFIAKLRRN